MLDEGWFGLREYRKKGVNEARRGEYIQYTDFMYGIIICAAIKRDDILELFVHVLCSNIDKLFGPYVRVMAK